MMIGIITYHSAYNFGSVLQAYATQSAVAGLGAESEIIDYRMKEQKRFYGLLRTKYGLGNLRNDLIQLFILPERIKRRDRYESFIHNYMTLSKEYSKPEEIADIWNRYPLIISGSDQIWNKYSCELKRNDIKYMMPYLLDGYNGIKVSYASSIGSMSDDDIKDISPFLEQFLYISMREASAAERMQKILKRKIDTVLDPTFLLNKDDWINRLELTKSKGEPYILYYSLSGISEMNKRKDKLIKLAHNSGRKLKIITPFIFYPIFDKSVQTICSAGPLEFMNLLYNADMVISDSYHGSALSLNLEKEIYSICDKGVSDYRKSELLIKLGLKDHIISDIDEITNIGDRLINYDLVREKIDLLRKSSKEYLNKCLQSEVE